MKTEKLTIDEVLKTQQDEITILTAQLQNAMKKAERQELLKKHTADIWTDGKNYMTYVRTKSGERRRLKRKTEEALLDAIVEYYSCPTVEEVYLESEERRVQNGSNSKATQDRKNATFKLHFSKIKNIPISEISTADLEDFLAEWLGAGLKPKAWQRLVTLVMQIWKRAHAKGYTSVRIADVLEDLDRTDQRFDHKRNTESEEAYTDEEVVKLIKAARAAGDQMALGIALVFYTGVRVGELVALQPGDFSDDVINITRAETSFHNGGRRVYEVTHPKTSAAEREIVISNAGRWIVDAMLKNAGDAEWLIMKAGKRVCTKQIRTRLKALCKSCHIDYKPPHKIRKTYASMLLEADVPEKIVQMQMGHRDITTTLSYYYKDRSTIDDKYNAVNIVQFPAV